MLITTLLQRLRGLIRSLFRLVDAAPLLLPPPAAVLRPVPAGSVRAVAAAAFESPLKARRSRP